MIKLLGLIECKCGEVMEVEKGTPDFK